jgi:beta-lactamase superfamily II metal-dependent hydrolase
MSGHMTDELAILDVGHGSCAVLRSGTTTLVVDAATRDTLVTFLEGKGIETVQYLLVSHSDDDHVGGVPTLLLHPDIHVERVYFNSDPSKTTRSWRAFRAAIRVARLEKGTKVYPQLTTSLSGDLHVGSVEVEILAPWPEDAFSGPGTSDLDGVPISANSMSAAVRVVGSGRGLALLCGDIEGGTLRRWVNEGVDLRAEVLVFPHHGGLVDGVGSTGFAAELCTHVGPRTVAFSIGRGRHDTPRPEIVAAIRTTVPDVRVACTQLSEHCAHSLPANSPLYASGQPARGLRSRACCAGTIIVELFPDGTRVHPERAMHHEFIRLSASSALCTR